MPVARKRYPSDVTDEEWSLVVAYLTLMREDAQQRQHSLRELFNGLPGPPDAADWRRTPSDTPALWPGSISSLSPASCSSKPLYSPYVHNTL
jgi:hypothetical protein